ncbi:hypothetical protein T4A_4381 [Trichinella pseudospiralis]|uniref:Uncharacterized protein n=1 Tax=Trichinella pseudospiralis TaxID=6337 RepID=A0A0V1EIP1_TRIPS|nr:hypothetical protein T4A_4381 [Trichinella pseudospiralis]
MGRNWEETEVENKQYDSPSCGIKDILSVLKFNFVDISVRISNEEIIFCKTQLIDKALNSGIVAFSCKICDCTILCEGIYREQPLRLFEIFVLETGVVSFDLSLLQKKEFQKPNFFMYLPALIVLARSMLVLQAVPCWLQSSQFLGSYEFYAPMEDNIWTTYHWKKINFGR